MSKPTFFVTPGYGPVLHELLHYSQALRVGDRAEISGQAGRNNDLEIPSALEIAIA